jgi:hypothetical protein
MKKAKLIWISETNGILVVEITDENNVDTFYTTTKYVIRRERN